MIELEGARYSAYLRKFVYTDRQTDRHTDTHTRTERPFS